ncbi:protein of unknown function [Nitrospira japonica]|uniref:Uncharacterized protein n=1 Tax=Nitrospira japonica TaxID=1325564 RepID=A0A1W1I4Y1_9BACT|nr:protein of unknown function [Nitrospira japonica]
MNEVSQPVSEQRGMSGAEGNTLPQYASTLRSNQHVVGLTFLLVRSMVTAEGTVLLHFDTVGIILLILRCPIDRFPRCRTTGTSQGNDLTHDQVSLLPLEGLSSGSHPVMLFCDDA